MPPEKGPLLKSKGTIHFREMGKGQWCRPGSGWNWAWPILREHEGIVSGCEVNRLIARLYGERLPSIDLAHVDLSRGEQRPEQHGCGVC
jgi:hypothetical protein